MGLVYFHGNTYSFQYRNSSLPRISIRRHSACMSFGGNEGFHRVTILGMDPRIIVTIFNNEEDLAAPAGAELITLSEAVPGCPTDYRPWGVSMLNAG